MLRLIDILFAFILVALLLLLGRLVKQKIPLFQKLYLPESIIAGFIALILGPGIVGAIARSIGGDESLFVTGIFPEATRTIWSQSPGVFINIVFAALFIGETIPPPREIWRKAAPQVAFGQSLAWGQYVVGLLLALLVLVPVFQMDPIAGALIEVAFEGGHGTAAGMADTFRELGFEAGPDLALGLATVGIVSGVVAGIILADWARRKGHIRVNTQEVADSDFYGEPHVEDRDTRIARNRLMQNLLIDPLSLNFGFVGAAIVIGWLILKTLQFIESVTWGAAGLELIRYVPLFPMALIGGLIVQLVMERLGLAPLIIRRLQERIAGVALDVVVVTALASINLTVLGANLGPFLILSVAGIIWNVWAFLYLGPRLLPSFWFERGIGDMGQSMGVTATGILLIRMVDPDNRTGAFESFAYKQLFFEPIVGGGLFTAAAPPLIRQFGPIPILILTGALLAFWIGFGLLNFKRIATQSEQQVG